MKVTNDDIQSIVDVIVRGYKPNRIILFGSRARGEADADSDIDLLVIKDDNMPAIKRNRYVRGLIRDSVIPVDIIVKTTDEYEKYRDIVGTVVFDAHKYGRVLYG
ncbi:MAG TPA: nucleotidyltransferase domain-containing protein [Spirochaetota bacterium]|nr:nucleotidyltransferase domain-containing protein [Spirochaetota bacterium]HQP48523.1 nucleotidyltransferase domain-containing protein [Spirochaetota bacterium]